MAVPIAELFVSVGADVSAAISNLTSLGTQVEGLASKFQQAAPAALLFEAAAAGIGAGLITSTKVAADFEHQMSGVKAVMTPNEINQFGDALSQLAIVLGRDTVFTSREAAAGIEELIKAGIPAEAVLGGAAASALNLAAATGISVPQAATVAAQTMNAFGKSASELTGVVDLLAGTANATAADMSDLQFGLQVVSATAGTMGLSFRDTVEAIGLFVSAGETGATAGTGLRQMLLELIPTTKPAKEEMLKLGLTTRDGGNAFFDAAGHVKSLADLAGILQKALRGMSDEQRIAALNTLFTRDAINSASILARNGSDSVKSLAESIGQISAADSAATRLGNLEGAMQNLGGSVESVQIAIGTLFLPKLTEIANGVRAAVDAFGKLDPQLQQAIVVFTAIGGAVAGTLGAMVLLGPFVVALGPAFAAMGSVLVAIIPFFLAAVAVAGVLVAAWQSNLGDVQGIVSDAFSRLPDLLDSLGARFEQASGFWEATIVPSVNRIGSSIGGTLTNAFNDVRGGLATLEPILSNFGLVFQKALQGDLAGAFDTFRATVGGLSEPLGGLLGIFHNVGGFVRDTIVPNMADLATRIMPALQDLAATVGNAWSTTLDPAIHRVGEFMASTVVPNFVRLAQEALPLLQSGSETMATFWDQKMQPAFQKVGDFIDANLLKSLSALGVGLSDLSTDKIGALANAFGGVFLQSFSTFGKQLEPLVPVFQSVGIFVAAIGNVFAAFADLQSRGQQAGDKDPLTDSLKRLVDFVSQNGAQLNDFSALLGPIGPAFKLLTDNGASVAAFFDNIADALNRFAGAIRDLKNTELPAWVLQLIQGNLAGAAIGIGAEAGGAVRSQFQPTSFNPNGPGGGSGGGGVVITGPVTIASEVDAENFLQRMANLMGDSAKRASVPPDNSGFPQLAQPGVI